MTLPVDALEAFGHREVPNGPTLRSRAWGTLKISSAAKRPDAIMPAEMSSGAKFPKNVGHPPTGHVGDDLGERVWLLPGIKHGHV